VGGVERKETEHNAECMESEPVRKNRIKIYKLTYSDVLNALLTNELNTDNSLDKGPDHTWGLKV
jgi:hypothetical protein